MNTYSTVEAFAEHVRQVTGSTLGALCSTLGPTHPVSVAIAELCSEAATLVHQSAMQQETADPDRYDLVALGTPSLSPYAEE